MQQVGKYQLVRKLATGGMAEVFLAKAAGPMGFEKTLVLKRILPHLAEEPTFVEMFLSEAKLAAHLTHPHVVQIFDFGEANGTYFLAMEYIDGPSLRTLIKRASEQGLELPLAVCARLVSHACEGLAFAHDFADPETGSALGLIHRDISPDNILLSRQGAVKVVDFGIAKAAGQAHRTASGVIKGKLSYMPPEQVRAESLDRRVDVYALGVVLYELLTGHKPFEAESDVGLMRAILFQSPMPAVQFRPELPDSLRRILGRAIAKDREQRYPDCHALQSDLEEFILSAGKPVTTQQIAQLIAQVAEPAPLPGSPRSGPTPSVTPAHTPAPAEEKTDAAAPEAPRTVQLRPPRPEKTEEVVPEAPGTVKLYPPQAEKLEEVALEASGTVKLYPPQAEKLEEVALETPQVVQLHPPQAEKTEKVAPEAPQTVQLRKPQAVKEEAPEAHSERPTAPDLRPLPQVPRPSREVRSAQRKQVEPRRGGKWGVALVACVLIAGGVGVVVRRTASSPPAPQDPVPKEQAVASPTPPPADEPLAGTQPEVEPPLAGSSEPSTDDAGVRTQDPLDEDSATTPQDAGTVPGGAPPGPVAPPPDPGPATPINPKPKRAPKLAKGRIEFRVRPYATVFLSGKELGDTPMEPVELLGGTYIVKLVNKDFQKTVTQSVRVVNGETTVVRYNFKE